MPDDIKNQCFSRREFRNREAVRYENDNSKIETRFSRREFRNREAGRKLVKAFDETISFSRREFRNREAALQELFLGRGLLASVGANSGIVRRKSCMILVVSDYGASVGANSGIVRRNIVGNVFCENWWLQSARIQES